jgi:hypothetical protein
MPTDMVNLQLVVMLEEQPTGVSTDRLYGFERFMALGQFW